MILTNTFVQGLFIWAELARLTGLTRFFRVLWWLKYSGKLKLNKTPAKAFTPPADEMKMGTIWIFVYHAVYGSGKGRCRDFLVLKWGGGGS